MSKRQNVTPDRLRRVAEVYRANLDGGAPTRAVQDALDIGSIRTARWWVNRARREGLLEANLHDPARAAYRAKRR